MDPVLLLIPVGLCSFCCILGIGLYYYYYYYVIPRLTGRKPKSNRKPKPPNKSRGGGTQPPTVPPTPPLAYEIPDGMSTNCAPNKRGVIGYQNEDRTGKTYMWCADDDHIGSDLHDKLSYLSIPRGMKATVYENIFKSGLVKEFGEGEWDLHTLKFENGKQMHDRISSMKIEGTPPDAGAPSKDQQYYGNMR